MKRIIVTVSEEYLLPYDWELVAHPEDRINCLHGDGEYFLPALTWDQRRFDPVPDAVPRARGGTWSSVDHELGRWFFQRVQATGEELREAE